jgi:hypothetical protein
MTIASDLAKVAEKYLDIYLAEVDAHAATKARLADAERDRENALSLEAQTAARLQAAQAELDAARRELAVEREQRAAAPEAKRLEDSQVAAILGEVVQLKSLIKVSRAAARAPLLTYKAVEKALGKWFAGSTLRTYASGTFDQLRGRAAPPARASPPGPRAAISRRAR